MTTYQDVWRDGQMVAAGQRDGEPRYALVRNVLRGLPRPFSVLDLGANIGYFAVRIVEDFPEAHVTAIDPHPDLPDVCSIGVQVLNRTVTVAELSMLPRVDIILALSVLHHFADWRGALRRVRACRMYAVVEVPHPTETWMRSAPARAKLLDLHDAVASVAARQLGTSPRTGRDGHTYQRPVYLVPGTVRQVHGRVFSGSGSNARSLQRYTDDSLIRQLGYRPYPGSLNLRVSEPLALGRPHVRWRNRYRGYDAWPAWFGDVAGHVMVPTVKRAHASTLEGWAPVRLRDKLDLTDGDTVTTDVETGYGA